MNNIKKIILFLCLTFSQIAFPFVIDSDYQSKWAGIEVIDTSNTVNVEEIRQLLPINLGEVLIAKDAKQFSSLCCSIIREKTSFKESLCSILFYGDGAVYLIVDLLSKEELHVFRKIPQKSTPVPKIPKKLNALHEKWNNHASSLMSSGNFIKENFENGFRDFEDPVLHRYALQLNQMAKKI